jgi:hypothetical protein
MLNFKLTQEELSTLSNRYLTDDKMFNYKDFCGFINSAFTSYGI